MYSAALRRAGITDRELPGERFLYGLFNAVGETMPSMLLARQGARVAAGRSSTAVRDACAHATDELLALVQPLARAEIESHRDAGRMVVMATTTPHDMVVSLGEALGMDAVIATRYEVGDDGLYTGELDGPFVWSAGKLAAVSSWADNNGVDLATSWAYSDSVFDIPLLEAVGTPIAVNPDARLAVVAATRQWTVRHFDGAPGSARLPVVNTPVADLAIKTVHPAFYPYARFDIGDTSGIPRSGPAIVCANHRSYFDIAAMAVLLGKVGRSARFLGKKEVFDAPVIGQIARAMGGIRVERASGSDKPLQAAAEALDAGELVVIMPQGTIPRGPAFFSPTLEGRWGAARLAEVAGAPVIPVGLWGTEMVWPRSARLPDMFNLVSPPTVRVRVGGAVDLQRQSAEDDTRRIMNAIQVLLPDEAQQAIQPTEEQLRRSYPPGYRGDPEAENARRPGTD